MRLNELHRGFFLTLSNDSSSSCSSQDGCSPRGALLPGLVRCQVGLPSSQMCHSSRPLSRYSSVFLSCALHRFGLARSDSQTDRETDTHCDLPLPAPRPLSRLGSLCARNSFHRARPSPPSSSHPRRPGTSPYFFKIKWAACATDCFYYIPASKTIDSNEKLDSYL